MSPQQFSISISNEGTPVFREDAVYGYLLIMLLTPPIGEDMNSCSRIETQGYGSPEVDDAMLAVALHRAAEQGSLRGVIDQALFLATQGGADVAESWTDTLRWLSMLQEKTRERAAQLRMVRDALGEANDRPSV
jgi:hypothetical protein